MPKTYGRTLWLQRSGFSYVASFALAASRSRASGLRFSRDQPTLTDVEGAWHQVRALVEHLDADPVTSTKLFNGESVGVIKDYGLGAGHRCCPQHYGCVADSRSGESALWKKSCERIKKTASRIRMPLYSAQRRCLFCSRSFRTGSTIQRLTVHTLTLLPSFSSSITRAADAVLFSAHVWSSASLR